MVPPPGTVGPIGISLGTASTAAAAQEGRRAKPLCGLPPESCRWEKALLIEKFQRM